MKQLDFLLNDLVAKKGVSKAHLSKISEVFDTLHRGGVPEELRGADRTLIASIREFMDRLLQDKLSANLQALYDQILQMTESQHRTLLMELGDYRLSSGLEMDRPEGFIEAVAGVIGTIASLGNDRNFTTDLSRAVEVFRDLLGEDTMKTGLESIGKNTLNPDVLVFIRKIISDFR